MGVRTGRTLSNWQSWLGLFLGGLSLLYLASAAAVSTFGSYSIRYGPFRLSSHSLPRDLLIAAAAGLLEWRLRRDAVNARSTTALLAVERAAPWIAGGAALAILGVGLAAGTYCACGSDAYGYVSEAALWARGTLHVPQPLASVVPWPMADWTFSPLGYRPATYAGAIVPTYAPGLPLLMALVRRISGSPSAVFAVVPAMGAVAVWCTFLLGRRLDGPVTGMWGAILLACSALFLLHVIVPMSDVPATAWWLVAVTLLSRDTNASALLGGLACSAAVLTRPNLFPLEALCAILPLTSVNGARAVRLRRLAWFCAGALPGPMAVAWIQRALYGSMAATGYGHLRDVYTLTNISTNARLYAQWLEEIYGPLIFLGLMTPVAWIAEKRALSAWAGRFIAFAVLFAAAVYASYLPYKVFDNWSFGRFLLPGIPLMLLLSVWTIAMAARRLGNPVVRVYAMAGFALIAANLTRGAEDRGIFAVRGGELRNIAAARYLAATSPSTTLVISIHHSGSVRYYGGRTTVRYDWLDPQGLDSAILDMQRMHSGPLLLLDDWEEPRFRERFQGQKWGALDWPPRLEIETLPVTRLYDPSDRDRYLAHEAVPTRRIAASQLDQLVR